MSKNIALVLSSGSSRGLAHIGAIEALEERGYTITSIAGCSIGALVGGMYAAGQISTLKDFFCDIDLRRMFQLTDFSLSVNHFVKGNRIMEVFEQMIPDTNIETLAIPFSLVCTDFKSGQEKVFTSGNLNRLIRASISVPVLFRPIAYRNMLLMDGGITNPLPLNRVYRAEGDILVYNNVSAPMNEREQPTEENKTGIQIVNGLLRKGQQLTELNYVTIINRITDIMIIQNGELMKQLYPAQMAVDIAQNQWGSFAYDHAEEIIRYGYRLMMNEIDRYEETH